MGNSTDPSDVRAKLDQFLDRALVPSDGDRERLLSFVVHELRNPLASALWAAEALARPGATSDPRRDRFAQLALRSMRRLRGLVEDLFSLERVPSRAPAGHVQLDEVLAEAVAPRGDLPAGHAIVDSSCPAPVAMDAGLVTRLVRLCVRRVGLAGDGGLAHVVLEEGPADLRLSLRRTDLTPERLDPPPLVTQGSEGGGTTFSLLAARALARTLGVGFAVHGDGEGGSVLELVFPRDAP